MVDVNREPRPVMHASPGAIRMIPLGTAVPGHVEQAPQAVETRGLSHRQATPDRGGPVVAPMHARCAAGHGHFSVRIGVGFRGL